MCECGSEGGRLKAKAILLLLPALPLVYICGCASSAAYKKQFAEVDPKLRAHDYQTILQEIDENREHCYKKKDRVLYYLDTGLLNHYAGKWQLSNKMLESAERAIEECYTKSMSRAASSMLLNDNVLVYSGEQYEDVYINVFNALNYIRLGNIEDAMVEVRRMGNKLNMLEDRNAVYARQYNQVRRNGLGFKHKQTKCRFYDSALGRYISMLVYRTDGRLDDARIDMNHIKALWRTAPQLYSFKMPPLDRALKPPPPGYAKINVISFIGRLPDKYARTLYITTRPRYITVTESVQLANGQRRTKVLETIPWQGKKPLPNGMRLKFEVPYMRARPSKVGSIRLMVNDCELGWFVPLESMEKVALETFKVRSPLIYMRAVLRTAIKSIACAQTLEELKKQNNGQPVPADIVSALFSATEHADLRVSQFFPAMATIYELDMPEGSYHLKVVYYNRQKEKIFVDDLGKVKIRSGRLNLQESHYLD